MVKDKLIYLAVFIISALFFILYSEPLSLIIFLITAILPVLLFIITVLLRLGIKMEVNCNKTVFQVGSKANISLTISNYSILPVSQIKVFVRYKNAFFSEYDKSEFSFYASPLSKNTYDIELDSRHTGKVEIWFKKAYVFDYLGIFSRPIKLDNRFSISFLPKIHAIEPTLRKNIYAASESNVYSKHKSGDDPSEIFAIRDYVDGDKLSRVHWKLSSKQDKFIVKDYSLLINESVLILPDIYFGNGEEGDLDLIDGVLEIAFSISHALVARGTLHAIAYYNSEIDKICIQKINDTDDLYTAFGAIFNTSNYYKAPVLSGVNPDQYQNMSHVLYIAPNISGEQCFKLSAEKSATSLYTLVNVVPEESTDSDIAGDGLNIINVRKSQIFDCLYDAVL